MHTIIVFSIIYGITLNANLIKMIHKHGLPVNENTSSLMSGGVKFLA